MVYVPDSFANRLSKRTPPVTVTHDQVDKSRSMLTAFFNPSDNSVRSIRECYIRLTGDKQITGQLADCSSMNFREALDSS